MSVGRRPYPRTVTSVDVGMYGDLLVRISEKSLSRRGVKPVVVALYPTLLTLTIRCQCPFAKT